MVLGKFKRNPFLVLTLLLGVIFQSCNSDYDEYVDEAEHSKKENTTDYDVVLQSREFKNYDFKYSNLMVIIEEVTCRMSKEEEVELIELAKLYMSDSDRYSALFRYKVANILGSDSIRVKDAFASVLEAKKTLMNNKKLSDKMSGREKLIFAELQINRDAVLIEGTTPIVKTRTENISKLAQCKAICISEYESTDHKLAELYLCGSAVNIALCAMSSGAAIPIIVIEQIGLTMAIDAERREAIRVRENCYRRCDLDWG